MRAALATLPLTPYVDDRIIALAAFLASPEADDVTGATSYHQRRPPLELRRAVAGPGLRGEARKETRR